MSLPDQLKSARMTDATVGSAIDDHVGDLEDALCSILGFTIDTNVTESPFSCDNAGRITKQLLRLYAAAGVGVRFRDTTNGKEFRLALNNTSILVDENTGTEGTPVWTNRLTISLSTGLPTLAGATDPSADNDLSRKAYVDTLHALNVKLTGAQSVDGVKTFTSFPVTPSSAPTTDYQVANKKYVDDEVGGVSVSWPVVVLSHKESSGTAGGGQSAGSWATRKVNTEDLDTDTICTLSSNEFTLPAGTYNVRGYFNFFNCVGGQVRLYNVSDSVVQDNPDGVDIYSTQVYASYGTYPSGQTAVVHDRFTIAGTKTLRFESRTFYSNAINGWGFPLTFGVDEIYAKVVLEKVA